MLADRLSSIASLMYRTPSEFSYQVETGSSLMDVDNSSSSLVRQPTFTGCGAWCGDSRAALVDQIVQNLQLLALGAWNMVLVCRMICLHTGYFGLSTKTRVVFHTRKALLSKTVRIGYISPVSLGVSLRPSLRVGPVPTDSSEIGAG